MASGNIAKSTFATGPDDAAAVVDVYAEEPVNTPLNTVVSTVSDVSSDLKKSAKDTVDKVHYALFKLNDPQTIIDAVKTGKFDKSILVGLPTSKEEAIAYVKGITGGALGQINSLKDLKGAVLDKTLNAVGFTGIGKDLAAGLLGLPGSTTPINTLLDANPKLKVVFNNVAVLRNGADLKSATGVISLLNAVTGDSELAQVLDLKSQFAVVTSLLDQSNTLKIAGLTDAVLAKQAAGADREALAMMIAGGALTSGNVDSLRSVLGNAPADMIVAVYPKAIHSLLKATSNEDRPIDNTNYTELVDLLADLDANWNMYRRNGILIPNLEAYASASEDAYKLLSLDPFHRSNLMIASLYRNEDIISIAKRGFPRAGI